MEEEGIGVFSVYDIPAKQLELASGDGYHWHRPAYQMISQEFAKSVLPMLTESPRRYQSSGPIDTPPS